MNALSELQRWYLTQCDGDWEHSYGVEIATLDNPGWILHVDLTRTRLEGKSFARAGYGVGKDGKPNGNEWLDCKVENDTFTAAGGPQKLEEMINIFLRWAQEGGQPPAGDVD